MKRNLWVAGFAVIIGLLVFWSPGGAQTVKKEAVKGETHQAILNKLIEGAKKEGQLEWWGTTDPEAARGIIADFNKVYPFIKVNHLELSTDKASQRMKLESQVGKCRVDILKVEGSQLPNLEAAPGLLTRWDPIADGFKIAKESMDKNRKAFANESRLYVIGYNTNLVKAQEAPKAWKDLLDPKWKGKVITKLKPNVFLYFLPLWGPEKTMQFVRDFAKNKPPLEKSGSTVLQMVVAGEHPVGIVYYHQALEMKKQGAPMEYILAEPVPMSLSSLVIAGQAPHPNAAKLWVGWELSKVGQESIWRHYWSSLPFPEVGAGQFLADMKGRQISLLGPEEEVKFNTDDLLERYYKILKQ